MATTGAVTVASGYPLIRLDSTSALDEASAFTMMVWYKPGSTSGYHAIISAMSNSYGSTSWPTTWSTFAPGVAFHQNNQTLYGEYCNDSGGGGGFSNGGSDPTGNVFTSTSTWYHVAAVVTKTSSTTATYKLYIDGSLVKTVNDSGTTFPTVALNLMLGAVQSSYSPTSGSFACWRVWQAELTAGEISAEKASGTAVKAGAIVDVDFTSSSATNNGSGGSWSAASIGSWSYNSTGGPTVSDPSAAVDPVGAVSTSATSAANVTSYPVIASLGGTASAATGTSRSLTLAASVAAGDEMVVVVAIDNTGASGAAPASLGLSDSKSHTWGSPTVTRLVDPGAASAGSYLAVWRTTCTTAMSTSDTFTVTTGATAAIGIVAAKATPAPGWALTAGTSGSATTTAGTTATVTTGSLSAGNIVFGFGSVERSTAPNTADSDTTNGSWSSMVSGRGGNSGTSTSNQYAFLQWKTVTGSGTQTYNVGWTTNTDACIGYLTFTHAVAAVDVDPVGAVSVSVTGAANVGGQADISGTTAVGVSASGTANVTGTADIAPTGAVSTTATGTANVSGQADIAPVGASCVSATGTANLGAGAAVDPTGAVCSTATATANVSGQADIAGTTAVVATACGTADISTAVVVDPAGAVVVSVCSTAAVAGQADIAPTGAVVASVSGTGQITAGTTIDPTGAAVTTSTATAAISATADVVPVGVVGSTVTSTAAITAQADVSGTGAVCLAVCGTADIAEVLLVAVTAWATVTGSGLTISGASSTGLALDSVSGSGLTVSGSSSAGLSLDAVSGNGLEVH